MPKTLSPAGIARCSDNKARSLISFETANKYLILPLLYEKSEKGENLHIAVASKNDLSLIQSVKFLTGCELRLTELPEEIIKEAIFISYKGSEERVVSFLNNLPKNPDQKNDVKILWGSHENEILRALEALIEFCIAQKASDLHLCPAANGVYARLRVQGELNTTTNPVFKKDNYGVVVRRLKVLSALPITVFEPQDGSFNVPTSVGDIGVRISIVPTIHGEKIALRFSGNVQKFNLESLGFSSELQSCLRELISTREGLILIAGPTGSGKTTTLYTLIELLSQRPIHVMSIEDPVERSIENVSQMQVNIEKKITFASGLRAILRQDPDAILVGEIRDEETAALCLKAATTGHLVLSSIHSGSAMQVIERFSQLDISKDELLSVCRAILSQRLASVLCNACKVIDLKESQKYGEKRYRRVGCYSCDFSGFSERKIIAELALIEGREITFPFGTFEDAWSQLKKDGSVETL